jgi:SAM-dependent methyltransferase
MTTGKTCPACCSISCRFKGRKNEFGIFLCRDCQTLFTFCENGAERFDYNVYWDEKNLSAPLFVDGRLKQIISGFAKYRQNNRLLDVGCGAGSLVMAAIQAGWRAEGIEISQPAVDFLRQKDLPIFHGELAMARFPDNSFDVVTASELLEHLPEPLKLLGEIARILRPGGLFWATTPHGQGVSARLLGADWTVVTPPEHLHLFSIKGMKILLEKAGFNQVKIYTHGTNPFEIVNTLTNKISSHNYLGVNSEQGFNRIETSYKLNEALSTSKPRRMIKNLLNKALNITSLGDGLKIWAIK